MLLNGKDIGFNPIPGHIFYTDDEGYAFYSSLNIRNIKWFSPTKVPYWMSNYEAHLDEYILNDYEKEILKYIKSYNQQNLRPKNWSIQSIKIKISYLKKYGSPNRPKLEKPTREYIDRFITKIGSVTTEISIDNPNKNSFDFIRLRMCVLSNCDDPVGTIRQYKDNILEMAVKKIENSKSFKKYGIPINYLKLDRFTYLHNTHEIELLFTLKDI